MDCLRIFRMENSGNDEFKGGGMNITPRLYIGLVLALIVICGGAFAALNWATNDFGLWRSTDQARIWELEKTSKYLLAHRYVPENFNSVLIGSSVSDNLDTRQIDGFKIYNLSMAGGNITEVGAAAHAFIAREESPGLFIVNLYPYLTRDTGKKSFQIHEKEYWGALYSLVPVAVWIRKVQDMAGMMHGAFDESEWGWNNISARFNHPPFDAHKAAMKQMLADYRSGQKAPPQKERIIDPQAYKELKILLNKARAAGFDVIGFYHPVNIWKFRVMQASGEWSYFRAQMEALFKPGEPVWDFNTRRYDYIRAQEENYVDTHLSAAGAALLAEALEDKLKTYKEKDKSMKISDETGEPPCDFDHWTGKPVDEQALKETGRPYRILPPGSMATMDYVPERINVHTDEEGIVTKVKCG